jgi:hypothetical protein
MIQFPNRNGRNYTAVVPATVLRNDTAHGCSLPSIYCDYSCALIYYRTTQIFRPNLKMNMDKRSPLFDARYWAPERAVDTDRAAGGIPYPLAGRMRPET